MGSDPSMNWEALGAIAEAVGAFGVIATLVYLAIQIRANTAALSAQARHSISEMALQITMFRAENAEQYARLGAGEASSPADHEFQYWSHMHFMLHAEMYLHHVDLGLMPDAQWHGYVRFISSYVRSPGFAAFWAEAAPAFSDEFRAWLDQQLATGTGELEPGETP